MIPPPGTPATPAAMMTPKRMISASSPKTGIRIASAYYRTPVAVTRILQD